MSVQGNSLWADKCSGAVTWTVITKPTENGGIDSLVEIPQEVSHSTDEHKTAEQESVAALLDQAQIHTHLKATALWSPMEPVPGRPHLQRDIGVKHMYRSTSWLERASSFPFDALGT